jgi:hypothetical protein
MITAMRTDFSTLFASANRFAFIAAATLRSNAVRRQDFAVCFDAAVNSVAALL